MARPFVLINTNVLLPPVSPVGLEYAGESLLTSGFPVAVIDLALTDDKESALKQGLKSIDPLAIGVSVRNTDDVCLATRQSFLPWIREVVTDVRRYSDAPIVLGGIGFSTLPEMVMDKVGADYGIDGDGEVAVRYLARALISRSETSGLPNLVYRRGSNIVRNPRTQSELDHLPPPKRDLFNNLEYERKGAMVGVETKRGCPRRCIYCADPVSKGRRLRLRPPASVIAEMKALVRCGVSTFHLCDAEFNIPRNHAKEVCQAIIDADLSERIRWYCYCSPTPFDRELAALMKHAGAAGVNFGVDSLDDDQLKRLGKEHTVEQVMALVALLREEELNYMFDFIIGGPGETPPTVQLTIELARQSGVPLAGMAVGVRVYPVTPLGRAITLGFMRDGLIGSPDSIEPPLFYVSPALGRDPMALVKNIVGNDPRFLVLTQPSDPGSYNYAGDRTLTEAIERGARGAYWDILGKLRKTV